MCLLIKNTTFPKIASKDIIVYKVILNTRKTIISPYRATFLCYEYDLPTTIFDYNQFYIHNFDNNYDIIIKGGFHCFEKITDAIYEKEKLNEHWKDHFIIECIIPKGIMYYKTIYNNCPCFCSKQLIINKII